MPRSSCSAARPASSSAAIAARPAPTTARSSTSSTASPASRRRCPRSRSSTSTRCSGSRTAASPSTRASGSRRASCRGRSRAGRTRPVSETVTAAGPLAAGEPEGPDAYWRAANYLSVGQIYRLDNPLLTDSLEPEHVKPRLLGHFGTTPGLNFMYAHLNRAIRARDLSTIFITGPGHGGPGLVANAYLEGTYSELYPHVSEDVDGLR